MKSFERRTPLTFSDALPLAVWLGYVCYVLVLAFGPRLLAGGLPELPCVFKWLTGLPCPFCGVTRSLTHLLQGDLREAVLYSPFSLPFFFLFTWLLCGPALLRRAGGTLPQPSARLWVILAALSWVAKLALPSRYW